MGSRVDDIARFASVFCPPGQTTELRALGLAGEVWAGWFDGADLAGLAAAALALEAKARGIYFIPNPTPRPQKTPLGEVATREHLTDDAHVLARKWLLIDVDPTRFGPDGQPISSVCPATDAEREAAWQVVLRCKGGLEAFGLSHAVVGNSGNGWHLCYPIDLPNDAAARDLCRTVLATLEARCGDAAAHVDTKTFNASRIWKLYGTLPKKGGESEGRTHRFSHVALAPDTPVTDEVRAANTAGLRRAVETWQRQELLRGRPSGGDPANYGKSALEREVGRVATAPAGQRNNTLNEAAFNLGQLVGGGVLNRDVVEGSLYAATASYDESPAKTKGTIHRGVEAGMKEPRGIPDKPAAGPAVAGVAPTAAASPAAAAAAAPLLPPDEGISCTDLLSLDLPEPRYIVPGLLPEGLTIFAARPKQGKSWKALQIALAVGGGYSGLLGTLTPAAGAVLYLGLEDTRRRLKKRVLKLLTGRGWAPPRNVEFRTASHRGAVGVAHIEEWLKAHPDARLVVVDTLQKFRPPQKGGKGDTYADDYETMGQLKTLADRYAVAILVIHHSRKSPAENPFDEVSGTLGITGAADSIFVLERKHEEEEASLYVTGRDVEEETLTLRFDPTHCLWNIDRRQQGVQRELPAALGGQPRKKQDAPAREKCAAWLREQLAGGARKLVTLVGEAELAGHTKGTLFRAIEKSDDLEQFDDPDGTRTKAGLLQWVRMKK
ncbi:MAG TPA: AAA family ATPase [Urbifossiella sp.]|nr:AAA family ATPase [Urbifossiella sp.]